ncbi:MAG: hypothetical protein M9900_07570 [Flavobacteriales bacterium]|nr:hypothetical protein [Flavobacteriales bacterium]
MALSTLRDQRFLARTYRLRKRAHARSHAVLKGMAVAILLALFAAPAHAQGSEDPSDATTALNANVTGTVSPALPTACTGGTSNGPFSMASVSTTTAEGTVPYPPCAVAPNPSGTPVPPKDIWFRIDPPYADAVYRVSLLPGAAPAMGKGGIALYEATSAAGPFRLLSCSTGGGYTAPGTLGTAEATGLTGGKVYVRVWDYTPTANSNFTLCIAGQRVSTMPDRGADETAASARQIMPVASFTSASTPGSRQVVNYVWAAQEPGFLPASQPQVGGDLWLKILVPITGQVMIRGSYGTTPSSQIGSLNPMVGSLGMSAYLASDPADPSTFSEVGSLNSWVIPGTGTAANANMNIRCLPGGAWLYIRFYSLSTSMDATKIKRFGQVRFEWMEGPLPYPGWTPAAIAANASPCGAVDVVVDAPAMAGSTQNGCNPPGIPDPYCGGFSPSKSSVWHKFTAPPSGMVQIDVQGAAPVPVNPAIALYTSNGADCSDNLALVACDDRQGPGNGARIIKWGLVPGQTYYVRTWGTSTDGTFSIQVVEPKPSAGNCLYMIDLWREVNSSANLSMSVSINGGPATAYTGDASGAFVVELPVGSSVDFSFSYSGSSSGMYFYSVWQAGSFEPVWWNDGGFAVYGPQPPSSHNFHIASACNVPVTKPITDCAGMKTICLDQGGTGPAPTYIWNSLVRVGSPINDHNMEGVGSVPYQGYTYSQGLGYAFDLAGANMGCLQPESSAINWLVVRPDANGTVSLMFQAFLAGVPQDLDFAIWDLGSLVYDPGPDSIHADLVCPPQTAPIRCSSARTTGYTGLLAGRPETYEGNGGYGFLAPLPVVAGHGYLIALMPIGIPANKTFTYFGSWTLYENALGVTDPSLVSCTPLVLPVELLFLAGLPNGNAVDLTWATATEKNSSHFVVERSTNNLDFVPIGRVAAAGSSQYRIDYGFTDPAPVHGVNYYRLRLVDLDGSTDLSNVVAVEFAGEGNGVVAWPNPVQELLHIGMDLQGQAAVTVQVLDAVGRVVQQQHTVVAAGQASMDVGTATLVPGAYMVRILGSSGEVLGTARFVKGRP